jgi:protease-4
MRITATRLLPALLVPLLLALGGCTGIRLIIDAVPASDAITETEVMADEDTRWGGDKVALIDVRGLLVDADRRGVLGGAENPVSRFAESLDRARRDGQVRAIIVRIDSPGGTVSATDSMHGELRHFREQANKPIVVLMADVAASGGYYLACGGDHLIAQPTSITGSIGVIIQTINFAEGMNRIGIRADAITSGPNKSMGSPFEPMPAEHRALLQGIVDEFYDGFRSVVVESRPGVSPADLDWITDGRVVTGRRAAEIGLVDATGDLRDAFSSAKSMAQIPRARLVKYHRPIEFVGSTYAVAPDQPAAQVNLVQLNLDAGGWRDRPGFYYLWDPSMW